MRRIGKREREPIGRKGGEWFFDEKKEEKNGSGKAQWMTGNRETILC
jgi:hypothetical protein